MSEEPTNPLNQETRQPQPRKIPVAADLVPTLTIVCHPDLRRVGERSVLAPLLLGLRAAVSRVEPDFQPVAGGTKRPLEDTFLTRKPFWLASASTGAGVGIHVGEPSSGLTVDGHVANGALSLEAAQLERGVLIELAGRVLLLLHWALPQPFPAAHGLIGASESMRRVHDEIERAASHSRPVLVLGETGSGKELVSRAVHDCSARATGPYVAVSLATIPAHLAEDELFGHAPGAFTGAKHARAGLFKQAHGGTLFLDEVGEASSELQAKLLRVTDQGELRPLGGNLLQVDVRLVAATDSDLNARRASGDFKSPLFHRLAGTEIRIPPLRERRDDIARLWVHFVAAALGSEAEAVLARLDEPPVSTALMAGILCYSWPGNVRELRHQAANFATDLNRTGAAAAAAALAQRIGTEATSTTTRLDPGRAPTRAGPEDDTLHPARSEHIDEARLTAALRDNQWKIHSAAQQLGISKNALYRLIEQSPSVRKGRDLGREEVLAAQERCESDTQRMAAELQVSERALRLRMTELGLSRGR